MTDPSTTLLIDCAAEIEPGQQVLVLGALDGALAVAAAQRVVPGGKLYLADYDSAALDAAEEALKRAGSTSVVLLSPDRLAEFAAETLDMVLLHILPFPSSALTLRLLHEAGRLLKDDGILYAAGPRDKGIVSVGKRMEELFGQVGTPHYSKGSRVVASLRPRNWQAPSFAERSEAVAVTLRGQQFDLELRDGVFARGSLDEGSALLCEALEIAADEQVLDLGCGGGLVGMLAARLAPNGYATLVDSNTAAVALANDNIVRNRLTNAQAVVSDVAAAVADRRFTLVATNPPFHQGRVQTTDAAMRFIAEAFQVLAPDGAFYLVCNRFLPYERTIREIFGAVREVGGNTRYRVLLAKRQV